jgi:ABC-type sugar transport system ATPase subunit
MHEIEARSLGIAIAVDAANEPCIEVITVFDRQIGSPQDVYERPQTRLVAGFVGSPPMNFFRGQIVGSGDTISLRCGSALIDLPPGLLAQSQVGGGDIELGVRPQHVTLSTNCLRGSIPVQVYAVERLGKEDVVVANDEANSTFRVLTAPGLQNAIGDRAYLTLDLSYAHLFAACDVR